MTKVTYIIRSKSPDASLKAKEAARSVIGPDEEITRTFMARPSGVELREVRSFRIGDYFDKIALGNVDSLTFTLSFQVSQRADRFWKDILIAVLKAISDKIPDTSAMPAPHPS